MTSVDPSDHEYYWTRQDDFHADARRGAVQQSSNACEVFQDFGLLHFHQQFGPEYHSINNRRDCLTRNSSTLDRSPHLDQMTYAARDGSGSDHH